MMMARVTALFTALVVGTACSPTGTSEESLHEVAKSRAGSLDVVLLTADEGLKTGKDTITVEFRNTSDGALVDVGTVKASAMMPMTGMSPMFGPVDIAPTSVEGRYIATSELSMAGEWRLSFEWNGPAGPGSTTFSQMVN